VFSMIFIFVYIVVVVVIVVVVSTGVYFYIFCGDLSKWKVAARHLCQIGQLRARVFAATGLRPAQASWLLQNMQRLSCVSGLGARRTYLQTLDFH
jgi:hypothetical protein